MPHEHDEIETWRRYWFPIIDKYFGHARGVTKENQYVATIYIGEETFEAEFFHELGFIRNPLAYLKSTTDRRESEGSWVLTYEDAAPGKNPWEDSGLIDADPGYNKAHRQLHATIYPSRVPAFRDQGYIELYAHEEYDWRDRPFAHLAERRFHPIVGREMALWLLDEHTYFSRDDGDYGIQFKPLDY